MSVLPVNHSGMFTAQAVSVIVCSAVALYNALELLLLIFTTFQSYRGVYFWSLLIASFGVIPYTLGWLIVYFDLTHNYVGFIIDSYGWMTMVTGQSVVLYSRLHLVLQNRTVLRAVKWMIVVDAILFHVSTTVVLFGSNLGDERAPFNKAYKVIEKIQMTGFCIQEFIISGIYVRETIRLLQVVSKKGTKRVMWQLFIINIIIIAMDIALLALEYRNLHVLEQAFKVVIYSIKLKLEFAILGKLVELVQPHARSLSDATLKAHTYCTDTNAQASFDGTTIISDRKGSNFVSHPQWLDDLEEKGQKRQQRKDSQLGIAQHVEVVADSNIDQIQLAQSEQFVTQEIQRPLTSRPRRSESDFMYADIMRTLSQ